MEPETKILLLEGLSSGELSPKSLPLLFLLTSDNLSWMDNHNLLYETFRKMIYSCENQYRQYVKNKLVSWKDKHEDEIKFQHLEKILKLSKNAFRDPYAKAFFSNPGMGSRISTTPNLQQITVEDENSVSVWEANQVHVQPFQNEHYSFSTFTDGEMKIRVKKHDLNSESQQLIESGKGFKIKSGFFWFQRAEARLKQSTITFSVKTEPGLSDDLNVIYKSTKKFKQSTDSGQFLYDFLDTNGVKKSGTYDGEKHTSVDNPGVPGCSSSKNTKFSHLSFEFKSPSHQRIPFVEVELHIKVEAEHKNLMDKFSRISSSPNITGIYFRIFE